MAIPMIDCYTWKTGNGSKALLMLAECGLPLPRHFRIRR
jgi:hypothetical protein